MTGSLPAALPWMPRGSWSGRNAFWRRSHALSSARSRIILRVSESVADVRTTGAGRDGAGGGVDEPHAARTNASGASARIRASLAPRYRAPHGPGARTQLER